MRKLLRRVLASMTLRPVLKEWALQIHNNQGPSVLAAYFLEVMRDPERDGLRRMCAVLVGGMKGRTWRQMRRLMPRRLAGDARAAFAKPEAERFYCGLSELIAGEIRRYWEQFMASHRAEHDGKSKVQGNGDFFK